MSPFEPAEKKFFFLTPTHSGDLRLMPRSFWKRLASACGGEMLTTMQSATCTAHVLSASSLFIWRNKALLITCGTTRLIDSAVIALTNLQIDTSYYLRRQANRPSAQKTSVESDVALLADKWGFHARQFSQLGTDGAVLNEKHLPQIQVLLMWGCRGKGHAWGLAGNSKSLFKAIQAIPDMERFDLDPYAFSPCGFSCNGIAKDGSDAYFALHQSPQDGVNYLSVETDIANPTAIFDGMKALFEPMRIKQGLENPPLNTRASNPESELTSTSLSLS